MNYDMSWDCETWTSIPTLHMVHILNNFCSLLCWIYKKFFLPILSMTGLSYVSGLQLRKQVDGPNKNVRAAL